MKSAAAAASKKAAKQAAKEAAKKAGKKVKKVKKPVKQQYRAFTRGNFRHNLTIYSQRCVIATCQAHHLLPVRFEKNFKQAGINPHHPKHGRWWTAEPGAANNHPSKAAEYNRKWAAFFDDLGWNDLTSAGRKKKKKQILKFAKKLDNTYKKFYRC